MYKSSKEHLSDILKESIEEFTKYTTKNNLTAQYNLEKERANAYHGRELLELLQNVDDAYEELCIQNPEKRGLSVETIIEYDETKSILRISNIGTVFSESSINRLCQGGVSQKKINFIGNKGTGFRSLLNWAKEIHIYSGEYSVGFSEEYANRILNSIKDIPIVQKQLKDEPKIKFPMLQAPYFIEPVKSDFDTVIEIIVKPDSLFDNWNINNQIKEFDKTILLFLPNITKIKFKLINEEYSFNKKKDTSESRFDKYSIQKLDNTDNILEEKSYFVFKKEYNLLPKNDEEEKKVKLCVAIPCKYEQLTNCKLYTFFPIKEATSPFNALLNATFELSQNRDSINNSVINQNVFNSLLEFYVDIIINNFCIKEFGDLAIQLLTPVRYKKDFRFNSPFDDDSIINKYIELCKSKKIFFNYNKEFISAQEYPKIDVNYPALFHNLYFKELIPIPSQEIICFLKDLSGIDNCEYSTKELYDRINLSKRNWDIENNIEVFIWWIQHYPNNEILPELIKDKNGNWLHTNDKCFFSGTIKNVPNWASYRIINLEYENKIIDYCSKTCRKDLDAIKATTPNEDDKRLVIRFIRKNSLIQTSEYSVSNLLSPLNESIDNDYDRAKDFVKWLWENKEIIKDSESIKNDNYNFPNKEGSVSASGSLFMGEEYNNSFGEQIFSNLEFKKFINPETVGISKENINDAKHFFNEYFGVLIYPKIHKAKINYERVKYDSLLSKYISIKEKKKCNYIESSDMIVNTIDKIDYILSKLDTETIIKFIFSYNDLYENIINTENNNFENLKYFLYRAHYWNTFYGKIPNYLTFVFSNYKWLEIGGKKYSPNECIFSEDSILCRHIPCITSDYIKNINISGHSEKEIKNLLELIGVKNKEIELSSNNFYKLLLSLQEQDNTNKISQRIYRECIKNLEKPFEPSENKTKFFENNGKVCVKNPKENESVYQPVNKVYFSSKNVLNLSNKYLIYIPLRTGNKQSIEEWFNVKEYTEEYDVLDNSIVYSPLNDEFRKNFKEYLPYAFCLRKEEANETEQRKFKNLSIKLVSEIKIKLDNTSKYITEKYALIQNKKNESQWFIYVGNILEYDDIDISKIGDLLEQIFSVIINTENKDKIEKFSELYVSNKDRRNHIIKKEFNSLDILRESKNFLDGIISDKDVLRDYLKKENLLTDEISNLLNKLDFSFIDDIETQKILFKLLKKLNMDVNLLNSKLNRDDISIYLYNKERLNIAINNIMKKIKQNIYNTLLNKELIDKKQFLKQIDDAKDKICNSIEIQNTIFFEPDNECKKYYEENYNIDYEPIDIEEKFKNNRKIFRENNQNDDVNKFLNNQEIKSLLYFDFVDVQKEFNKFISNNTEQTETETQTEAENNENRIVTITDNVKPVIENTERHGTKKSFHKIISSEEQQKQTEKNQRQGDLAEQIVVNKLRNYEFPELNAEFNNDKYNIIWCSGAAERIENYNGNDSLGYDIELELNGKTMYIEVKSSSKEECSFEMSSNEYNFAIKQRDNYRLIFVANINNEPKITLLTKDFLKTFETIPKSYIIQFKIKK